MKKIIFINQRLFAGIVISLAILSFTGSCKKTDTTPVTGTTTLPGNASGPGANEVWIQGMSFTPAIITVTAGTTVTWTNKDAVGHTVTSTTGIFNSGSFGQSKTYSQIFTSTGSYPYFCSIHPSMTGTVVVN
jgi:plastocyanin